MSQFELSDAAASSDNYEHDDDDRSNVSNASADTLELIRRTQAATACPILEASTGSSPDYSYNDDDEVLVAAANDGNSDCSDTDDSDSNSVVLQTRNNKQSSNPLAGAAAVADAAKDDDFALPSDESTSSDDDSDRSVQQHHQPATAKAPLQQSALTEADDSALPVTATKRPRSYVEHLESVAMRNKNPYLRPPRKTLTTITTGVSATTSSHSSCKENVPYASGNPARENARAANSNNNGRDYYDCDNFNKATEANVHVHDMSDCQLEQTAFFEPTTSRVSSLAIQQPLLPSSSNPYGDARPRFLQQKHLESNQSSATHQQSHHEIINLCHDDHNETHTRIGLHSPPLPRSTWKSSVIVEPPLPPQSHEEDVDAFSDHDDDDAVLFGFERSRQPGPNRVSLVPTSARESFSRSAAAPYAHEPQSVPTQLRQPLLFPRTTPVDPYPSRSGEPEYYQPPAAQYQQQQHQHSGVHPLAQYQQPPQEYNPVQYQHKQDEHLSAQYQQMQDEPPAHNQQDESFAPVLSTTGQFQHASADFGSFPIAQPRTRRIRDAAANNMANAAANPIAFSGGIRNDLSGGSGVGAGMYQMMPGRRENGPVVPPPAAAASRRGGRGGKKSSAKGAWKKGEGGGRGRGTRGKRGGRGGVWGSNNNWGNNTGGWQSGGGSTSRDDPNLHHVGGANMSF
jgi:hypothetical protein